MEAPIARQFRDRPDDHRPEPRSRALRRRPRARRRGARRGDGAAGAQDRRTGAGARRPRPPRLRPRHAVRRRARAGGDGRASRQPVQSPHRDRRLDPDDPRPGARDGLRGGRADLPRRRPRGLDGHDHRRRPRPGRGGAAHRGALARRPRRLQYPRDHAERQHARHGAVAGDRRPDAGAGPRRPPARGAGALRHHHLRGPLDRSGGEAAAARARRRRDRHARDRRARRLGAARGAHRPLEGGGGVAARQLRPRLPRPGGRARHRHRGAGRRHLPRGAPGHGDALRFRDRRLARRGRAQPLPRRARPLGGGRHRARREPLRPHRLDRAPGAVAAA